MVEKESPRVEVDTSAPFDSVKEAASRFGEVGYWRRCSLQIQTEAGVAEQATILEKELLRKEKETIDILKQLQSTKTLIDELKCKLRSEDSLEKAKICLTRTTSDLTGVRSSLERLNKKLESESAYLERARDRITLDSSKVAAELGNRGETTEEVRLLAWEIEKFSQIGESAKSEAMKAISEMEETKTRMKTIEARITATRKLQEASRAVELAALSKMNTLSRECLQEISLPREEYANLKERSRAAEENAAAMIKEAMRLTERAVASKSEMVKKVEEASEEVKKSKQVLEEALRRVEAANSDKIRAEEALRKWRSDRRSQTKKCFHTKDCTTEFTTDSTIGEILRRKLSVRQGNSKVNENSYTKRNKFELPRFPAILLKNAKKMSAPDLR